MARFRNVLHFLLSAMLLCSVLETSADGPFRKHRFDSFRVLNVDSTKVVFLGNSITDMHDWAEAFQNPNIVNRGVSGALSGEILDYVGDVARCCPKKIFLMIGTNDLGSGVAPETVADNVRRMLDTLQQYAPATQVFLQSILPSTVGTRTLELESATNKLLRELALQREIPYVDLWELLSSIPTSQQHSLDGLHLKASGYRIWCDLIASAVGSTCVYDDGVDSLQKTGGLWGSFGMRATYCSMLPVDADDVLFFGDEMVKCGEWRELLHDENVKNRGTGWGYDGIANSIAITQAMVDVSLGHPQWQKSPRKILLYTATGNVNGQTALDTVFAQYQELVFHIRTLAPETPIAVVGLMPTEKSNKRILQFNRMLRRWCAQQPALSYVDIYHPLARGRCANPRYFSGDYLMGTGYLRVAKSLSRCRVPLALRGND